MTSTLRQHGWLGHAMALLAFCAVVVGALATTAPLYAQAADPPTTTDKSPGEILKEQQQQIAARYKRFEEVLLRMAEITASDDPQRAALLRQAVARSKKQLVALQYERLLEAMDGQRYSVAMSTQADLTRDLKSMLELLLNEDRSKRLESEQERVRAYLKQLNKLIKDQQGVEAQTRRGRGDDDQLADRQDNLADDTGKLGEQVKRDADEARRELGDDDDRDARDADPSDSEPSESDSSDSPAGEGSESQSGEQQSGESSEGEGGESQDGESQEGQSPEGESSEGESSDQQSSESGESEQGESGEQQSGQQPSGEQQSGEQGSGEQGESSDEGQEDSSADDQPTDSVQQRLQQAQQRMREATERLKEAQRDDAAEQQRRALEELEQAKAELEKILRQLREEELARVLAMLEARFRKMLAEQKQVYESTTRLVALPADQRGRSVEIESGRLGRQESQIALEADKALTLLREDGSAVAMPEAVRQLRDDMQQVSTRLSEFKLDALTVGLEEDIIAGLEDILAALEKAKQELEQKQQDQQMQTPAGEPQEPPLVDALAELKMIRALQMRVNRRTDTYSQLIDGEQAVQADLLAALEELAQRQERIYRATKDIAVGRNR